MSRSRRQIKSHSKPKRSRSKPKRSHSKPKQSKLKRSKKSGQFHYTLSGIKLDDRHRTVKSVWFSSTRYNQRAQQLRFPRPVTVKTAVQSAEEWLSKPVTRDYFALLHEFEPYDKMQFTKATRGDLLGVNKTINKILGEGVIFIQTKPQ